MRTPATPSLQQAIDAVSDHRRAAVPRLQRLWEYYRNPVQGAARGRAGRLAQESGLPARRIDAFLDAIWERSGGIALLQDIALLGHVYGYVDLIVRIDETALRAAAGGEDWPLRAAEAVRIEVVEPTRGVAIVSEHDYRVLDAYVLLAERRRSPSALERLLPEWISQPRTAERLEVLTREGWEVYEAGRLVERRGSGVPAGELPVVHIQNISQPFRYEGLSEVEALIPLQDELNTRLSDRASRVTMQSFKMYLARGLEGFDQAPIGPGLVWSTENTQASIEAFGGDAASPSEEAHIREIRDALDKASAVPPLASGVVQAKIGNLSSANALRITLMGVLSKTARKRVTYGSGIARACRLALDALDDAGVLALPEPMRGVRLQWPDPLPADDAEQVRVAQAKADLGVPRERVLAELGYPPDDEGLAG